MEMHLSGKRVDLDKCFTDVNKAGKRDRGRRGKEDWERKESHRKDQEGGVERGRDKEGSCPSLPKLPESRNRGTHPPQDLHRPPVSDGQRLPDTGGQGGITVCPGGMPPACPGNSFGSRKQLVSLN